MAKTVKLFFLMLIFIFSMAFTESKFDPEKYRLYVTQVDPEFHCFALSNGMSFYTIQKRWDTEKLPEVGIEVGVHAIPKASSYESAGSNMEEGEFYILYSMGDQKRLLSVWMPPEFEQYCLSYVSAKSVSIKPDGWFSSPIFEHIIELSDGSKWIFNKDQFGFDQEDFEQGDHVIVSKFGDIWSIIDVSKVRSVGPRRISSKTVSCYPYELDHPNAEELTKE